MKYVIKTIAWLYVTMSNFTLHMHWRQPGFTYSACRPFSKQYKRIPKFRETGNLKHLYRNELDKACFAHDAAYSTSKDLAKRTISDKVLKEIANEIAITPKFDGYQRPRATMVNKFFEKKTGSGASVNEVLAKELPKPVIKKIKRRVYVRFKDNIWAVGLTEMGSLSSKNRSIKYLICHRCFHQICLD